MILRAGVGAMIRIPAPPSHFEADLKREWAKKRFDLLKHEVGMIGGRGRERNVVPGIAFFLALVFATIRVVSSPCPGAAQAAPPVQQSGIVLHVETREVVIDVVARDGDNLPITNLAVSEFEVYDVPKHADKIPRRILYLRTVAPEGRDRGDVSASDFHVSSGAVCALDYTIHYQIAIQASAEPGYHTVLVKTTRPHVSLTFRRQYYVGHTRENATPKNLETAGHADGVARSSLLSPAHASPRLRLLAKCWTLPAAIPRVMQW